MINIYIIVLTYNGNKETHQCLESLSGLKASGFEYHTVVVDNNSKDAFKLTEQEQRQGIKLITNNKNSGFSGGNNRGIDYSLSRGADYILLLNNDTYVDKGFLEQLLSLAKYKNAGLVCPKIYFAKGFEFHKNRYAKKDLGKVIWYAGGYIDWDNVFSVHRGLDEIDEKQFEKSEPIDFATGCAMLVKRDVFEKVGKLDNDYFLYYEDADFSVRVKRGGFKMYYCPKALVFHKNSAASGSGSNLHDYYLTRNQMHFGVMYAPFKTKIALVRQSLKLLFTGRKWQRKGIIDYYRGNFGKGSFKI